MSAGEILAIAGVLVGCGGLLAKVRQLEREVERLRAWRHKIGDNPTQTWAQALNVLARRIDRMEKRD